MGWYDLIALTVTGISTLHYDAVVYVWPYRVTVTDAAVHTASVANTAIHTATVADTASYTVRVSDN